MSARSKSESEDFTEDSHSEEDEDQIKEKEAQIKKIDWNNIQGEERIVFVTGANGYLGLHIIDLLLKKGFKVKATVHSLATVDKELLDLQDLYPDYFIDLIELKLEDYTTDWIEKTKNSFAIIHTAFPDVFGNVENELDVLYPCIEGMLNILIAAKKNGIGRVIVTGSLSSVRGPGYKEIYRSHDWADPENLPQIERIKLITEKTAWQYYNENPEIGLTFLNVGLLLGPSKSSHYESRSCRMIKDITTGKLENMLRLHLGTCDVRDAAKSHILAMVHPESAGKRMICLENSHWFEEIIQIISENFTISSISLPTKVTSWWSLKMASYFDRNIKAMLPFYNKEVYYDKGTEEKNFLLDEFTSFTKSILDMLKDMKDKKCLPYLEVIE